MAVEVVQFLVRKFVDSLTEDEAAAAAELPFGVQFHDMKAELEKAAVSPTNADELRECLYELNDLLAECRTLTTARPSPRWCFARSDAWRFNRTKKRVAAVRRRVSQCAESFSAGDGAASLQEDGATATVRRRWTTPWVERSSIHGFDRQLAELESVAFAGCSAGRLNGVGIVGMGGVGKTVLAQLLFNSPRARGCFVPRIWVCMSRTACAGADVRKEVLQGILMALGHEEDDILSMDGINSLAVAVHEQLVGKRYLIVFDDMWRIDGWYADVVGGQNTSRRPEELSERLAFVLPKERGGVVLVTSRLVQAAEAMVGKSCLHRVQPLDDNETCWAIFMDALSKERRPVDFATVNSMKEQILETCKGLPEAAKTMGDVLSKSLSASSATSSQELSKSGGKSGGIISGNSGSLK
ncbi:hypothetical protein ACP4OV_019870 [Aristida adscensionis]